MNTNSKATENKLGCGFKVSNRYVRISFSPTHNGIKNLVNISFHNSKGELFFAFATNRKPLVQLTRFHKQVRCECTLCKSERGSI